MMRKLIRYIAYLVNLVCGVALLSSAWGGGIDPRHFPIAAVVVMLLPLTVPVCLLVLVADILWWRKAAVFMGLCVVAAFPAVLEIYPLNSPPGEMDNEEQELSWTLLTYNVIDFQDQDNLYPGGVNPTVSYILRANADVVCLQEAEYLCVYDPTHITVAQVDSVRAVYPHILLNGQGQCLLSRFPVKSLPTGYSKQQYGCDIAGYELEIHGRRVALYNIHLQSIGLTGADKAEFVELTKMKERPNTDAIRHDLIGKLEIAAIKRAGQTEALLRDIKKTGGENVVVCGDFNDVPGCWSLRQMHEAGLNEVYPAVGLGYMRTYNRNRLYFRIDHVLYRGNLHPRSMTRGNLTSSDHFPLLTTFIMTPD